MSRRGLWRRVVAVASVAALIAAGVVDAGSAAAAPSRVRTHRISVHPLARMTQKSPSAAMFNCQTRPIDGSQGPRCYVPAQIKKAYGITPLVKSGLRGQGRTIVIVDAFQNPYVQTDLSIFSSTFGMPQAQFQQIAPFGLTPFDPNDGAMVGWAEEIALDVQWAHAIAPLAKIVLALAKSNQDADILDVTRYVVAHNVGDVISQSFGEAETCVDPTLLREQHSVFAAATRKGISLIASSGDSGAAQFNCAGTAAILAASSPASDPYVTGVGGTTLNADAKGTYLGETTWTEPLFGCNPPAVAASDINCSGGGYSTLYRRPWYQAGVPHTRPGSRGVPDVAYDAGVNGGVLTHCGICNYELGYDPTDATIFFIFGGTSAGTPQWAGLVALADQLAHHRLGLINPALYAISHSATLYSHALHDITVGTNYVTEIGTGYSAKKNWDAVTGLGTPNAVYLLPLLALLDH